MFRFTIGATLMVFALMLALGCSTSKNPVADMPTGDNLAVSPENGHEVMGVFQMTYNPETNTIEVVNDRVAALTHLNFTKYLSVCPGGCLKFYVTGMGEDGWLDITASMQNPYDISPFDVRILIADSKGKSFEGYDGISTLFPSIGQQWKAFYALGKTFPFRQIPPYTTEYFTFKMKLNPGCQLDTLLIAECSLNENIAEPYEIISLGFTEGYMTPKGFEFAKIGVRVNDWQDNIDWVKIDCSPYKPGIFDMTFDTMTQTWEVEVQNERQLGVGTYTSYVFAYSDSPWQVQMIAPIQVSITREPWAQQIVYTKSPSPMESEIHTIYTDMSDDYAVTNFNAATVATGVSADFSKIIYNTDRYSTGTMKSFRCDLDGSNTTPLFGPKAVSTNSDGSIVLLYDELNKEMWIYDAASYDLYKLPINDVTDCVMAADMSVIAYISDFSGTSELYMCDLRGGMQMPITSDGALTMIKSNVTISNDGLWAAYDARDKDVETDMEIYLANLMVPDSAMNISMNSDTEDTKPQLSGDGQFVVFVGNQLGAQNIYKWDMTNGVQQICYDSFDPQIFCDNPDVNFNGTLIVYERHISASNTSDIIAWDGSVDPPVMFQVTVDGMSILPLLSSN